MRVNCVALYLKFNITSYMFRKPQRKLAECILNCKIGAHKKLPNGLVLLLVSLQYLAREKLNCI